MVNEEIVGVMVELDGKYHMVALRQAHTLSSSIYIDRLQHAPVRCVVEMLPDCKNGNAVWYSR